LRNGLVIASQRVRPEVAGPLARNDKSVAQLRIRHLPTSSARDKSRRAAKSCSTAPAGSASPRRRQRAPASAPAATQVMASAYVAGRDLLIGRRVVAGAERAKLGVRLGERWACRGERRCRDCRKHDEKARQESTHGCLPALKSLVRAKPCRFIGLAAAEQLPCSLQGCRKQLIAVS